MSYEEQTHSTAPPVKGAVRLIFDEKADVERAADWLEQISGGRVALGPCHKGRKGGWIVRGHVKLPVAAEEVLEPPFGDERPP